MHHSRFLLAVALLSPFCWMVSAGEQPTAAFDARQQSEHCTAFVLDNGGHGVFGANFDHTWTDEGLVFVNKRGIEKHSISGGDTGNRIYWTSRFASVSFNLVGYEYAWGGMNEAGLSISTMSLAETTQPPPDDRPVLDNGEWVQYLLDTCATVEDVIATDDYVRILTVDHYLVGDGAGNAATIEFLDGHMVVHTGQDLPVAVLTNNTYEELLGTWNLLRGDGDYSWLGSSPRRFCLAADRVDGFSPRENAEAIDYAVDTLGEVRGERFSASPTNWSLVFDTEHLRAYFTTRRNRRLRWIDLNSLDLRCGRPVMMMDVNAGNAGDVSDELIDFDRQLNRSHFERFLRIWGIGLSPQEITWILDQLEGFDCAPAHRRAGRRVAPSPG